MTFALAALLAASMAAADIEEPVGNANEYNPNGMILSHIVPGNYSPGERLEVVVQVDFVDQNGLTAAGVTEEIPPGWIFAGMGNLVTGVNPNITPQIGASDVLGFAWITVQGVFPSRFSYFLRVAEEGGGPASILGQGQYRTNGGELYSNVDTVTLQGVDNKPPEITLLGNNPEEVTQGSAYRDAGATANDNVDGDVSANIQVSSNVNTAQVGTYVVSYTVRDASGNQASATRTVRVVAESSNNGSGGGTGRGGTRTGNRGYGFATGVANQQAARLDQQLDQEQLQSQMEDQRQQEEAANAGPAGPQNALEAARVEAQRKLATQGNVAPRVPLSIPSPGNVEPQPAGNPGEPMPGPIPTGNISTTRPPATPAGAVDETRAAARETDAAVTADRPRSEYPQDAPGTQLNLREEDEDGGVARPDGEAGGPGVFGTITGALGSMRSGDYVRLGVGVLILAFIISMATFAWRVAYSPKPQRRHANGAPKDGKE
ncbi:immunoglobulin-like domain-containing protein [Roseovarius pacificus]|uniref:DUF5011 domain-containing protein n=1 Tax=Roseovarius pacificus TaxID=337701 RepID=UPI002A188F5B|nr:immunoglobulin-like domain-containing protein [Roseovarius pacificus]